MSLHRHYRTELYFSKGFEMASEATNLTEVISNQETTFMRDQSMCNREAKSTVHAREAPVEVVAELMMTAERELAAFYQAVFRRYGPREAKVAAQDWIGEVETMDWPVDGTLPRWRYVTIGAADCVASRIVDHSPGLWVRRR
jgi:hypothetical protein